MKYFFYKKKVYLWRVEQTERYEINSILIGIFFYQFEHPQLVTVTASQNSLAQQINCKLLSTKLSYAE